MTRDKVEHATFLLAEIDALRQLTKVLSLHHWDRLQENNEKIKPVHIWGSDFGKPNASDIMTHVARGNRTMFGEMEKIVEARIEELKKEFNEL